MTFKFTDKIKPRIADINYGGHVGHTELINLLHEIRVRFLHQHSLSETDIAGHALVMHNINVSYHHQIFWNNELEVTQELNISGAKIVFDYSVINLTLGNRAATSEARMVLIDKEKMKTARPEFFVRMLNVDRIE